MSEHTTPAVAKVAANLSEIIHLHGELHEQAIHSATDPLMPGGLAMVALGNVASLDEWSEQVEAAEHKALAEGRKLPAIDDEDDWEPPLQTLLFWSESWRTVHGYPLSVRPTISGEANFIRWALGWAWDNDPRFEDFAKDVQAVVARLEVLLSEGLRAAHGAPCLDCNVDLIRPSRPPRDATWCDGYDGVCTWPHKFCDHDRGGLADEWKCPECDRRYDVKDYRLAVGHLHFVHADYLPIGDAVQRTGAPRGSIQAWATKEKGLVRKRKDQNSGRMTYCIGDIEARLNRGDDAPKDGAA